jgi:hypothetical protein
VIETTTVKPFDRDRVVRVASARLSVSTGEWLWARRYQTLIDAHWLKESAGNANFFNGTIFLIDSLAFATEPERVAATLLKTDFKSYLYWRDLGYPPAGVLDGFGSALIRRGGDGPVTRHVQDRGRSLRHAA